MKAKLLIVDDEKEILEVLKEELTDQSVEVTIATQPSLALEILKKEKFTAILSDIKMPGGIDGLSFLATVRAMNPYTPFVLMTGFSDSKKIMDALRLGVTDFLEKPITLEKLKASVLLCVELGTRFENIQNSLLKLSSHEDSQIKDQAAFIQKEFEEISSLRALYRILPVQ